MTQANAILGLYAQTSIHAGTGQSTGAIDLPIQREGHNGYPCIYGSAMKGALRSHAETQYGLDNDSVNWVFGPAMKAGGGSDYAGALMISDARILLLPIRSLTSQFKWVTCPAILSRYQQDAKRFGLEEVNFEIADVPPAEGEVEAIAVVSNSVSEDSLFLEEYRFKTDKRDLSDIINALASLMAINEHVKDDLTQQLAIVSNDMFSHICQHATPVNAHIAIDSATKVVKKGTLWYEETLPPESLMYVGISAHAARQKDAEMPAKSVLASVIDLFPDKKPYLQVGGNETVGMGWCAVKSIQG